MEGEQTPESVADRNQEVLPGGPIQLRPIQVGEKTFDPLHSPKLYLNTDGTPEFRGGKEIDLDQEYADKYWEGKSENLINDMKNTIIENIHSAAQKGKLTHFVDPKGISEKDKEKLSAYRKIAEELGYEVGSYTFNDDTYVAAAPIKRKINE